jgi:hypothetical protein
VFEIDIKNCNHCNGAVKVIASIKDQAGIKQKLEHIQQRGESVQPKPHPDRPVLARFRARKNKFHTTVLSD